MSQPANKNGKPEEQKDKLLDHLYDGIQELDNRLPTWWLWLFYLTIAFAAVYFAYYNLGSGPTLKQELRASKMEWDALQTKVASGGLSADDEAKLFAKIMKDEARLKQGKEVFMGKCLACHGPLGQGTVGPNLTDNFWIHGGAPVKMAKIIRDGVNDKGMPPWGPILKPEEVQSVVVYIKSLAGTNPPGAKPPQGTEEK
jgi:cytochrome c oxidase cbb3-type subunit 3